MDLVSAICSYCSILFALLLLLHVFARFLSSFLQDCEADMKNFVALDIYFFICNVLGGETFILCSSYGFMP